MLRRPGSGRRGLAIGAVLVVGLLAGQGDRSATAAFADAETVPAGFGVTGSWNATTYWLHHVPTPPTSDTVAPGVLAMDTVAPSAAILRNYDTDLDAGPGRVVRRGGSGPAETAVALQASWRGPTVPPLLQTALGSVTVEIWTAAAAFTPGVRGELTFHLRDRDTLTGLTLELGSTTVAVADWQGPVNGWRKTTATLPVNAVLLSGHQLELKLTVPATSATDMWIAYDTLQHRARVRLP